MRRNKKFSQIMRGAPASLMIFGYFFFLFDVLFDIEGLNVFLGFFLGFIPLLIGLCLAIRRGKIYSPKQNVFKSKEEIYRNLKNFQIQAPDTIHRSDTNHYPDPIPIKAPTKPNRYDKESNLALKVDTVDMIRFENMPYDLDCRIQRGTNDGKHYFAYMDLTPYNVDVAKGEISYINVQIETALENIKFFAFKFEIPLDDLPFRSFNDDFGYVRLLCTPKTPTGRWSTRPLKLQFKIVYKLNYHYTTGFISYADTGNVVSVDLTFHDDGVFWMLLVRNIDGEMVVSRIDTNAHIGPNNNMETIYRLN